MIYMLYVLVTTKRKRQRSIVWEHFKKTAEKTKAICSHCGKILKTAGNTTNLSDHLKRIHPNLSIDETVSESTGLTEYLNMNSEYPSELAKKEYIYNKICLRCAQWNRSH